MFTGTVTPKQANLGKTISSTYDSKHNLTSATNDTVKMTLTNNAQGLTTSVTLADKTGSLGKTLQSSAGYSSDFRFQTSSTDVNGSTSSAEYDALGNRTAATVCSCSGCEEANVFAHSPTAS